MKFRVNAQGKTLDAWLIYRCERCSFTWNYPIHERIPVKTIDPADLDAMLRNDNSLAARYAFDADRLTAVGAEIEATQDVRIMRVLVDRVDARTREIATSIVAATPCGVRLDRVLSLGLGLRRSELKALSEMSALVIRPGTRRPLSRAAFDGQEITIDLSYCPSAIATKCLQCIAHGQNEIAISGVGS